jgi:hypothetical protein
MSGSCEGCEGMLEPGWVACPHCGRPVAGKPSSEKLVRLVTKVGVDLLEAGLVEAENAAQEEGDRTKAARIALARNLAKDVAPKIADAVTTYLYQRQVIDRTSPATKGPPALKGSRRE